MNTPGPSADTAHKAELHPAAAPFHPRKRPTETAYASLGGRVLTYQSQTMIAAESPNVSSDENPNNTGFQGGHSPPESPSWQQPNDLPVRQGKPQVYKDITMTQARPSGPSESPLKRPRDLDSAQIPIERPLQRPKDDNEEIAFSDIIATFAVDVSGSTQGKVLEEEKDVIRSLCSGLSRDAQTQVDVIPWNHTTEPIVRLSELNNLRSSGGTEPNSLNISVGAKTALSKCSAWFLLTDGEIYPNDIRDFSNGICQASLHGTPCVIVLFGYKSARPSMCNVSVGLSVFSNAPDCLFLFHDIDTTQVYILQSKGRFNAVLPRGRHEIVLDTKTLWQDLPTFAYRQLFDLPLPTRQQLRPDDLLLQGGKTVNLQDLYTHRVNPATAREIMENDDNLKSVLLAAQLRGNDDEIGSWISKQKLGKPDALIADRPDAKNEATRLIRNILYAMLLEPPDISMVRSLQQETRVAHLTNWEVFLSTLGAHHELEFARDTIVSDAMTRIQSNRSEMSRGTSSPGMLAQVSPRPSEDFQGTSPFGPPVPLYPGTFASYKPTVGNHFAMHPQLSNRCQNVHDLTRLKAKLGDDAGVLFIRGYKYVEEYSNVGFKDTCPICGQDGALLTALLKLPPKDLSTPGFPKHGDRKGLAYPLAMGSYPETDVLSSYICCDSCAETLVRGKMHLDDGETTAAIPLMPNAFSGKYEKTTLNLIDVAFQKRFHRSAILLVFLSTIYSTLANFEGYKSEMRSRALKKMASWMSRDAELPLDLSMSITGGTPRTGTFGVPHPLTQVVQQNLRTLGKPGPPLLKYPVGGFVVLTLLAENLNFHSAALREAVWLRFLFHLVQKHYGLVNKDQTRAISELQAIFQDGNADASKTGRDRKPYNVYPGTAPATLCGTHLLSDEEFEDFQRLESLFDPVRLYGASALKSFIVQLSTENAKTMTAMDLFDTMRARDNLRPVFEVPNELQPMDES